MNHQNKFSSYLVFILIGLSIHPVFAQSFKAVDDTIDLVPGFSKTVNLLSNDLIPSGDSIRVTGGLGAGSGAVISTWHYQGIFTYLAPNRGIGNILIGNYTLINVSSSQSSVARLIFRIRDKSYDTLKINDVEAMFTVSGLHFFLPFNNDAQPYFFVPKGSNRGTMFNNSFWIGGLDENDSLHLAAERYRQGNLGYAGLNPDFYAGPVMDTINYSIYQDTVWNYIWNLKKTDIDYHKQHWNEVGYSPIHDILTWPGNGNVSLGQAGKLAPFHDANGDGIYNPFAGDCPSIRGDQSLFFIFNDDRGKHLESKGEKLRIEIHGMAYAYNMPGDSAFSKTVFLNYKIYNRSLHAYHNVYMGSFTDLEIGFARDDYIQCDVGRGSIIGYNGKPIDGSGQEWAYGAHPPAQSVTFLAGPRMEPAGADRPRYDNSGHPICNESVNGTGFGDGIADNERLGLSTFLNHSNYTSAPLYKHQPAIASEYYNSMQAIWLDGTRMVYGGNGHMGYGGYGPEAAFMFPGESDTLNWGCGCQLPNGPVNWTEETAMNLPFDISASGSSGPFMFRPGEMQELDIAFVWARDYTGSDTLPSVAKLRNMIDTVRKAFLTNTLPGGGSFLGSREQTTRTGSICRIYPNPATSIVTIDLGSPLQEKTRLEVFNSAGVSVKSYLLQKGSASTTIEISGFPSGLYLLNFSSSEMQFTKQLSVSGH
jgi:hypothetical protein